MTDTANQATQFRVADLRQNRETRFDLRPDANSCEALAKELGVLGLKKLRLAGSLQALGKSDWEIKATLGATVTQPCVVTLEPVTTRLDVPVERRFIAGLESPASDDDDEDIEMPEDENAEPLGSMIDIAQVMAEALALNLPLYPRKDEADIGEAVFTEPGKTAMRDEDTRPFAGLAELRNKLSDDDQK
ncbi:DUF177 domain-containing protein [uncultured Shimia sp.]|uniref:YceD family protein n=1 Tax=uncultured Shimia sp. TaxID=573152 RepID=UPI002635DC15|nr:DUF177 domain-containing protein [uncultured Shimia sp.]